MEKALIKFRVAYHTQPDQLDLFHREKCFVQLHIV